MLIEETFYVVTNLAEHRYLTAAHDSLIVIGLTRILISKKYAWQHAANVL